MVPNKEMNANRVLNPVVQSFIIMVRSHPTPIPPHPIHPTPPHTHTKPILAAGEGGGRGLGRALLFAGGSRRHWLVLCQEPTIRGADWGDDPWVSTGTPCCAKILAVGEPTTASCGRRMIAPDLMVARDLLVAFSRR